MAIKATFSAAGLLSEIGDGVDNTIVTSRDAAGQLFVNGGAERWAKVIRAANIKVEL
jgi:hypothetical protein